MIGVEELEVTGGSCDWAGGVEEGVGEKGESILVIFWVNAVMLKNSVVRSGFGLD